MPDQIEENLAKCFAAESKAAARNATFALKAERDGFPELANLFRAVSNAESVHAHRFLLLMRGKIGSTEDNLKGAYENEQIAGKEYPPMVQAAKHASKAIIKAFTQSMKTDSEHGDLYKKAMENMLADSKTQYYVCQICGHISEDSAPENCPVCHAVRTRFQKVG